MPVILDTLETEIRRMVVHDQPTSVCVGRGGSTRPQINGKKLGRTVCTYHLSNGRKPKNRRIEDQAKSKTLSLSLFFLNVLSETLSPKITRVKRARGMAQVVECLPSKCKALS
jgi:hypothetical protein